MHQKTKSLLEVHVATIMISFNGLFAKFIELDATVLISIRAFIAAAFLLTVLLFLKKRVRLHDTRSYFLMVLLGALLGIHWIALFYAIQVSTVAIGIISLFTFPVMTAFVEPFFEKAPLSRRDILSGVLVLIGVALVVPELSLDNSVTQGVLLGVLSALAYTFRNILSKRMLNEYPSSTLMLYQVAVVFLLSSPVLFIFDVDIQSSDIAYLLVLAIILTAGAHTLFVKSMKHLKAHTASIIYSLQPIYATVLAIYFLNEIPSLSTILGGLIIFMTVLLEMKNQKKDVESEV